ncbi:hypothetical protein J6TS2_42840 [Heyndrickxia sporothermodurans]|nr:hypothetical protein J6TS2_42840 [Heyndrickxia sporothermodurans]
MINFLKNFVLEGAAMKKVFIIDGNNFSDFKGFCKEFSNQVLSGKHQWNGNLDAFNDILWGGFGDIESQEEFTIIWKNTVKSRKDLGYSETIKRLYKVLASCHPSNEEMVIQKINDAKMEKGQNLFDLIEEIILDNKNVTLISE